jgi:hypothetical protein
MLEYVSEENSKYFKAKHLDIDLNAKRIGKSLAILEQDGVVERWSDSTPVTWVFLGSISN